VGVPDDWSRDIKTAGVEPAELSNALTFGILDDVVMGRVTFYVESAFSRLCLCLV